VLSLLGLLTGIAVCDAEAAGRPYLWQTNAGGDDIHVIDVATRKVVRRLVVGPQPHGIAAANDGRMVYVSLEADGRPRGELVWIKPRSGAIVHRLAICREPHAIDVTPDGRWIYVPCRDGHYRVVDAEARAVVKRIETGGRPHNTRASRDGRFMYLSPMGDPHRVTIVDVAAGHTVVGTIPFSGSVRPSALSADNRYFFQHVDGLNGFQVAEIGARKVVATLRHRTSLGWFLVDKRLGFLGPDGFNRCHGLAVRPDQSEIWSVCGRQATIHGLTAPDFPELAGIRLPAKGYWLTFSPDSRQAFVALSEADEVAVIDTETRAVVDRIAVGTEPKRNLVITY
jgi:YVTN family beta-propeller protein